MQLLQILFYTIFLNPLLVGSLGIPLTVRSPALKQTSLFVVRKQELEFLYRSRVVILENSRKEQLREISSLRNRVTELEESLCSLVSLVDSQSKSLREQKQADQHMHRTYMSRLLLLEETMRRISYYSVFSVVKLRHASELQINIRKAVSIYVRYALRGLLDMTAMFIDFIENLNVKKVARGIVNTINKVTKVSHPKNVPYSPAKLMKKSTESAALLFYTTNSKTSYLNAVNIRAIEQ